VYVHRGSEKEKAGGFFGVGQGGKMCKLPVGKEVPLQAAEKKGLSGNGR